MPGLFLILAFLPAWRSRALGVACTVVAPLIVLLSVAASPAQEAPRLQVDHASTQQKAVFLGRLVTRSVAVKRIEESGDADALAKLEAARRLVEDANAALKAGDVQAANDKLDAALELVNRETRRLSEQEVTGESLLRTYERRRHAVETFLAAYERVAAEKESGTAAAVQIGEIRRLMGEAEALAGEGRLEQGILRLDRAYRAARGDIRELRDGETLTRSLDFETPEAEYDYERNRNDSHVLLLRFALREKQPVAAQLAAVEELRAAAARFRDLGEQRARTGDHAAAIDALVRSTDSLLKAIRMSGFYIPG